MKMNSSKIGNILRGFTGAVSDPFPRDFSGLPEAEERQTVELDDGDSYALYAAPVRKRIGKHVLKMLAYNGSIPGPTLIVKKGSEVTVDFTNQMDLETTVHWHGLRLDNRFDGVPQGVHHGMQPPVPPGGSFAYRLRFPDPGVFWYHPHIREDYAQEHGLYGNILVIPEEPGYWSPVNREIPLVLDDILIQGGKVAPFSQSGSFMTAMGRFGNVMLVNGDVSGSINARQGEVIRFYLTNTANVRTFNFCIPGARLKLVGSDNGRVEREQFVEEVLISPSERIVLDVFFERASQFPIEHRTPKSTYTIATVEVSGQPAEASLAREFSTLRTNPELEAERARIEQDFDRDPDRILSLVGEMPGMRHGGGHQGGQQGSGHHEGGHQGDQDGSDHHGGGHHSGGHQGGQHGSSHHEGGHHPVEEIEWEDNMLAHNRMTTPENMLWKIIDRETGAANHDIHWLFNHGEQVKIRIINEPDSDHPMQHPFHFHGQRFLMLNQDGVRNDNLAWKDTTLIKAGETVDILLDCSNPGTWMAHCHIAEHLDGGMMFTFHVGHGSSSPG